MQQGSRVRGCMQVGTMQASGTCKQRMQPMQASGWPCPGDLTQRRACAWAIACNFVSWEGSSSQDPAHIQPRDHYGSLGSSRQRNIGARAGRALIIALWKVELFQGGSG